MEELESTSRHSGSRAGHLAGISINISGKVPRMLYVFKSPRGYSHSPGLGNHCSSIFLFKSTLTTVCGSSNICANITLSVRPFREKAVDAPALFCFRKILQSLISTLL